MPKTPQSKIDANVQWARDNADRVRIYKQRYKYKTKNSTREYVRSVKSNASCKYCNCSHPACLDFHHRDGETKRDTVCNLVRHAYSLEVVQQEVEKCDIICSNCHRKTHYTGRYMRNKKGIYVHNVKSHSKCECGVDSLECLDFHHADDNKEGGIGAMIRDKNVTLDELAEEISKCIVICSNCHRKLHASEREKVR